jgi:hypothetical protein
MHLLLQRMDFTRLRAPPPREAAEAALELGVTITGSQAAQIASALQRICESPLAARLAACTNHRREQAFVFSLALAQPPGAEGDEHQQLITGSFDLIAQQPRKPALAAGASPLSGGRSMLIVDYKSGPPRAEQPADLEQLVRDRFEVQRIVYALAALRDRAELVEVVHWFLARPLEPVSATYSARHLDALEEDLRSRIEWIAQRGCAVSEHPHRELCLSCPGRATLCPWGERHTLRQIP